MIEGYSINKHGIIKQDNPTTFPYTDQYVNDYRKIGEEKLSHMAWIRYYHIMSIIQHDITSVLDIGYGTGHFLKVCSEHKLNCYGYDVVNQQLAFAHIVDDYTKITPDVTTFFDSLEHFSDVYEVMKNVNSKYVVISLPWCHYFNDTWFRNWKHRKPNEHIWHFNNDSLQAFMLEFDYTCLSISSVEDIIRWTPGIRYKNILTGIFVKT